MPLPKTSILGVSITSSSRQEILDFLFHVLSKNDKRQITNSAFTIVTPNPEQIIFAQKNEKFKNILNRADIALPDGAGVVWAMNRKPFGRTSTVSSVEPLRVGQKTESREQKTVFRISGVDFMVDLCHIAAEKKIPVLFYGGRGGVAGEAFLTLKKTIPNLDGIAMDGAEFSDGFKNYDLGMRNKEEKKNHKSYVLNLNSNENEMIKHLVQVIKDKNIQVVFLGLGAPKQEYLMEALRLSYAHCPMSLMIMVVGGAFDMLAGKVTRAPKFIQTMGFEWLWRLVQEPWRWRRQLSIIEFLWLLRTKK